MDDLRRILVDDRLGASGHVACNGVPQDDEAVAFEIAFLVVREPGGVQCSQGLGEAFRRLGKHSSREIPAALHPYPADPERLRAALPVLSWYRELRVKRIGEGPSEVHRVVIARDKLRNTDGGSYFG